MGRPRPIIVPSGTLQRHKQTSKNTHIDASGIYNFLNMLKAPKQRQDSVNALGDFLTATGGLQKGGEMAGPASPETPEDPTFAPSQEQTFFEKLGATPQGTGFANQYAGEFAKEKFKQPGTQKGTWKMYAKVNEDGSYDKNTSRQINQEDPESVAEATEEGLSPVLSSGNTINVNSQLDPYQKELMTGLAKENVKEISEARSTIATVDETLGKITQAQSLIESGVETGWGSEAILKLKQIASTFGLKIDVSSDEALFKAVNDIALAQMQNFKGQTSDRELQFSRETTGNMPTSTAGNMMALDMSRIHALKARKTATWVFKQLEEHKGKLPKDFLAQKQKYMDGSASSMVYLKEVAKGNRFDGQLADGTYVFRDSKTGERYMLEVD